MDQAAYNHKMQNHLPYAFRVRGNAKSAGTHDAPIPGLVTSRRVHKVVKVPQEPVITKKQRAAIAAEERKKRERRERSASARRKGSKRSDRSESSESDRRERKREEERQRRKEKEEDEQRKIAEDKWKAQQAEREAKQAQEQKMAMMMREKEEARKNSRKSNLKGLFAVDDDLDEVEGGEIESAQNLLQKKPVVPLPGPADGLRSQSSHSSRTVLSIDKKDEDALQFRASLADPAAAGQHAAADVASQYKLLMEMKRKYRGRDFGGPASQSRYKTPSRSRSRRRRRDR